MGANKMNKLKVSIILLVVIFILSGCGSHNTVKTPSGTDNQTSENAGEGISWAKKYSGIAYFNSVQEMLDGGYILAGDTNWWDGSVISNILVLKVSSNGEKKWAKAFGKNGSYNGMPVVQLTNDGGYIVAGITGSYVRGSGRFIVVRFNSKNEEEWAKAYGLGDKTVVSSLTDFSIQRTTDGGYIVAGHIKSINRNCFLLKLDSKGNKEWLKMLNVSQFHSMEQTNDGGYIVAGGIGDHPLGLLIKIGKTGRIEWAKKYKVSKWGNEFDDVKQTKDGGYVAVSSEFAMDIGSNSTYSLVLKLDKDGNKEWEKVFGPSIVYHISSIGQTNDGGYIAAGWKTTASKHSSFVIKLSSGGNPEWGKIIDKDYILRTIRQTTDGGYIAAGMAVFKLNSKGDIENSACLRDYKTKTVVSPFAIRITDIKKYIKIRPNPSFRAVPVDLSPVEKDVQVTTICEGK